MKDFYKYLVPIGITHNGNNLDVDSKVLYDFLHFFQRYHNFQIIHDTAGYSYALYTLQSDMVISILNNKVNYINHNILRRYVKTYQRQLKLNKVC